MRSVGERYIVVGGERIERQPMSMQLQLSNHFGRHQREDIRQGRDRVAGPGTLTDGGPAQDASPFEYQGFESCPAQIGGSRQPVVPATDDDRVVFGRHPPEYSGGGPENRAVERPNS